MNQSDRMNNILNAALAIEQRGPSFDEGERVTVGGVTEFLAAVSDAHPTFAEQCLGLRRSAKNPAPVANAVAVMRLDGDLVIFARLRPPV